MIRFLKLCLNGKNGRIYSTTVPPSLSREGPSRIRLVDVEGMIQQASTRVSVEQLIRKGKKFINLLSREKIDELINRSIKTIVDKHRVTAAHRQAISAAQLEKEARAEFEELILQYQQTADATGAVEQSKRKLAEDLEVIRFDLDPAKVSGQDQTPTNLRNIPEGGFEDFVRELDRQVVQAFQNRTLILGRSASQEAVAELTRIEGIFRAMFTKLVQVERLRLGPSTEDAREITILKKRMDKFTAHIAELEAALTTLSTAKTFSNQQVQNLLRDLGLVQEDKNYVKKKEMLKVVLQANQGIRKKAREYAERGITLDSPEEKAVFSCVGDSQPELVLRSRV